MDRNHWCGRVVGEPKSAIGCLLESSSHYHPGPELPSDFVRAQQLGALLWKMFLLSETHVDGLPQRFLIERSGVS